MAQSKSATTSLHFGLQTTNHAIPHLKALIDGYLEQKCKGVVALIPCTTPLNLVAFRMQNLFVPFVSLSTVDIEVLHIFQQKFEESTNRQ